jgi:hypothetical protein
MNDSIKWDRYLKNPVLVEQHMSWKAPIGRLEDIKLESDKWTGIIVFASTKEGQKYKQLYDEGYIRAVSLGGNAVIVEDEFGRKKTKSFDVFEISLVTIPSNANAVYYKELNAKLGHIPVEYKLYSENKELITLSSNFEELMQMEEKEKQQEVELQAKNEEPQKASIESPKEEVKEVEISEHTVLSALKKLIGLKSEKKKLEDDEEEEEKDIKDDEEEDKKEVEENKAKDKKEKLESEDLEKKYPISVPERLSANPDANIFTENINKPKIMTEYQNLHSYLSSKEGQHKMGMMALGSDLKYAHEHKPIPVHDLLDSYKELASILKNDRDFINSFGQVNLCFEGTSPKTTPQLLDTILAAGNKTYNFLATPDLVAVQWLAMYYRMLFPINTFADRIPRISSDSAGTIHPEINMTPKVYFDTLVPKEKVSEYLYDDDPIAIPTYAFSLNAIAWQPGDDNLLRYDKRGIGMAEALRVVSNAQHNYIIQQLAEAVKEGTFIPMTGTATVNSAGMFPANPAAKGNIKDFTVADLLSLRMKFIQANFNLDIERPEVVMDAIYANRLQSNDTFVNALNLPTENIGPMQMMAYGMNITQRSICGVYDTTTSKVVDPQLYGEPLAEGHIIDSDYTPVPLNDKAYGCVIGFLPSQFLIGVGRTNVFVKQEPTLWAWEMSMDTRMGAGAARKDGVGIYGVAPAVTVAGA